MPGSYSQIDDTWDLDAFLAQCQIQFVRKSERTLELDLIGVDASIANAFRRIIVTEFPTTSFSSSELVGVADMKPVAGLTA